ncbi:hypothetical protein V8G54_021674, partial [Vigna mungo]
KKAKKNSIIVFFQHATCTLVDRQSHPQLVCVSYHFSVHRWNILSENSTSVRIKKVHNKLCKISIPAAPSSLPYPSRFSLVGSVYLFLLPTLYKTDLFSCITKVTYYQADMVVEIKQREKGK